ncbi:MAG: TonB-dependent receptor, partial [Bacteroidota bacterium]
FKADQPVNLQFKRTKIRKVLKAILKPNRVTFKAVDNQIVLFLQPKVAPPERILSGYVEEIASGEKLIAASIFCEKTGRWALSNEYGYFSLRLPEGPSRLRVNYTGCQPLKQAINLIADQELVFSLQPSQLLTEIVVRPDSNGIGSYITGSIGNPVPQQLTRLSPDLAGESDVLRAIQLLPGVQTGTDGFGGIYVRGGGGGHNLMLLDGATIYNPLHLLGVFSIYNTSAIRTARLMRGAFPARFGGRLSSVFDVYTKDGSRERWGGEAELGFLSGKASVEGPLFNGKGSLFLAGRRSHFGFLLKPALRNSFASSEDERQRFNFYDFNAKFNYTFSQKDRLLISFYKGGDFFERISEAQQDPAELSFDLEDVLRWGNTVFSLRWNHLFGKRLFANTIATYSFYDYQNAALISFEDVIEEDLFFNFINYRSQIEDYSLKTNFDFLASPTHHFRFGGGVTIHGYRPFFGILDEESDVFGTLDTDSLSLEVVSSSIDPVEVSATGLEAYVEDEITWKDQWRFNLGLRWSAFNSVDSDFGESYFYSNFEPRIQVDYQASPRLNLRSSFGKMVQYVHLVSSGELRSPADVWLPSAGFIPPEKGWLGELGGTYTWPSNLRFSFDTYYKKIENIIASLSNGGDEDPVLGEGYGYGFEWMLEKQSGRTGGWLNYTLSWADRQFGEINDGRIFPHEFDGRHQVKVFAFHRLNSKFTFSLNWIYQSGLPIIAQLANQNPFTFLPPEAENDDPKNADRARASHRLDLAVSYQILNTKSEHHFKLSIYNVYNRKNIAFHRANFDEDGNTILSPVHLMPFMPSLQYRVRF